MINGLKVGMIVCTIFIHIQLVSQRRSFFEEIKGQYPGENLVQLKKHYYYKIDIENGQPAIILNTKEKFIVLKNSPGIPVERTVYTSAFTDLIDYEANSYVLGKRKYKKIVVDNYSEKMNTGYLTFYDDVKEYVFTFPGIAEGTVFELNTTHKIYEPRLLKTAYLKWVFPVRDFELRVECDQRVKMDILQMNVPEGEEKYEYSKENNYDIHVWSDQNLEKIISEKKEPDVRYFVPHIIPVIRYYEYEGQKMNILKDTRSLYQWYYSFIEDINEDIDETELQVLVDSMTRDCKTDFEIVKKLYYWVQDNIKYIAFEFGLGGFVPRKPDVILKNYYGDCKDKSSLLYTMLGLAGINSYFTWIGTNDIPYTYSEVSAPATDNHMIITYVDQNQQYYFLDGTGRFQNIEFPTSFIQGKEALIGYDLDYFETKTVPVISSDRNRITDVVLLEIENATLHGEGKVILDGYNKIDFQFDLSDEDEKKQRQLIEDKVEKGSNKFVLEDYNLPELNNYNTQMTIDYSFNLENYINTVNNEIYINLNLYKKWLKHKIKKERKHPMQFEFNKSIENKYHLIIPDGYELAYLPGSNEYNDEYFSYVISYSVKNNKIIYRQEIKRDILLLQPDQFEEWNTFIGNLEKAYRQTILLQKNR